MQVGIAFDLASAVNVVAGAILSDLSEQARARLSAKSAQQRLDATIRAEIRALGLAGRVDRVRLREALRSDDFIALVADEEAEGASADRRASVLLDGALADLSPTERDIVFYRLRQLTVRSLIEGLSPADQLSFYTLQNIDEASLFLVNITRDSFSVLERLRQHLGVGEDDEEEGDVQGEDAAALLPRHRRSLLAVTIQSVAARLEVQLRDLAHDGELLLSVATTVDLMVTNFEAKLEQAVLALHTSEVADYYGSAGRLSNESMVFANSRLRSLSSEAVEISEILRTLTFGQVDLTAVADLTAQIAAVETFLVLHVSAGGGLVDRPDNLAAPDYPESVGPETLEDLAAALLELNELRMELRAALASAAWGGGRDLSAYEPMRASSRTPSASRRESLDPRAKVALAEVLRDLGDNDQALQLCSTILEGAQGGVSYEMRALQILVELGDGDAPRRYWKAVGSGEHSARVAADLLSLGWGASIEGADLAGVIRTEGMDGLVEHLSEVQLPGVVDELWAAARSGDVRMSLRVKALMVLAQLDARDLLVEMAASLRADVWLRIRAAVELDKLGDPRAAGILSDLTDMEEELPALRPYVAKYG